MFRLGAEWLERALGGELSEPGRDVRSDVHRDGGTSCFGHRTWWLETGQNR